MKRNSKPQDQFKVYERNGQLVFALDNEMMLPENVPVRLVSAQLEELDYRKLYEAYSPFGRKSAADPRVMFKVMVYGYLCQIYSSRKLEEACRYRIDFLWLLEGEHIPDHATFARFRTGRSAEAVEDLFYQYVRLLQEQGETDHETVFIDGTKLESTAGRYTFVWRKSVEKQLAKVKKQVEAALSVHTLPELEQHLEQAAEELAFVHGKGKRKSEEQKAWERLDALRRRWQNYETQLSIMGKGRNSYSKTDPDATFMRMKDDHMRNGQLKPGYNVQIAVNSEYITGVDVFSNRTDSGTMVPFLKTLQREHGEKYASVTADAGYERLGNYLFLRSNGQLSFIKPANHEQKKQRKFRKQIGRVENMAYSADEACFTCAHGRRLPLYRECTELQDGHFVTTAWYRCEDCRGCPLRAQCCQAKNREQPKVLRINRTFQELRNDSLNNISTERGIYLRLCRSIQVEEAFGLLKTDFGFRRFLTRGNAKVRAELFFLALAFDLKKLWTKRENGRLQTHLSRLKTT